jgi:hypothetical protein
LQDPI